MCDATIMSHLPETHKGHGTDFAIISGILGFATDDERVPRVPLRLRVSEGNAY